MQLTNMVCNSLSKRDKTKINRQKDKRMVVAVKTLHYLEWATTDKPIDMIILHKLSNR